MVEGFDETGTGPYIVTRWDNLVYRRDKSFLCSVRYIKIVVLQLQPRIFILSISDT